MWGLPRDGTIRTVCVGELVNDFGNGPNCWVLA